jgi:protein-disulfide isomerase
LEEVKPKRSLDATILQLKLCYFGHVMRAEGSLEQDIMLRKVAGYRRQGKPWMRWLDSIKEATGLRLDALKEAVQDMKKWCILVEEKTRNRERTNVK